LSPLVPPTNPTAPFPCVQYDVDDDDESDDDDDSDEWTTDDDSESDNEETAARKSAARRAGQPSKPTGPEPPSQEVLKFLRQQLPRPVLLSRTATSLTLSILARKDALETRPLKGKVSAGVSCPSCMGVHARQRAQLEGQGRCLLSRSCTQWLP
jgi:hypothetical protein